MKQLILLFALIGIVYTASVCSGAASSQSDCFSRTLQDINNNYCCYVKIIDAAQCIEYPRSLKVEDIMKQFGYSDVACNGKYLKAGLLLLGMLLL